LDSERAEAAAQKQQQVSPGERDLTAARVDELTRQLSAVTDDRHRLAGELDRLRQHLVQVGRVRCCIHFN
jgi:putative heme degradation protein